MEQRRHGQSLLQGDLIVVEGDAALLELVPRSLRRLGRTAVSIARFGVERTLRKYGGPTGDDARAVLHEVLTRLRSDLARSGGHTLLGTFSYADITMAQTLVFIAPPITTGRSHLRIAPSNRVAFTDAELAAEFADLVAWRDALYARHRTS
jgi:glutathione S-transferase